MPCLFCSLLSIQPSLTITTLHCKPKLPCNFPKPVLYPNHHIPAKPVAKPSRLHSPQAFNHHRRRTSQTITVSQSRCYRLYHHQPRRLLCSVRSSLRAHPHNHISPSSPPLFSTAVPLPSLPSHDTSRDPKSPLHSDHATAQLHRALAQSISAALNPIHEAKIDPPWPSPSAPTTLSNRSQPWLSSIMTQAQSGILMPCSSPP